MYFKISNENGGKGEQKRSKHTVSSHYHVIFVNLRGGIFASIDFSVGLKIINPIWNRLRK
jgi:hypothetical protein